MLSNSTLKYLRKLKNKKYRQKYGEFLVEGKKGVQEAIKSNRVVAMIVVGKNNQKDFNKVLELAKQNQIRIKKCNSKETKKIKTTKTFPGILAVVKKKKHQISDFDKGEPIICLDKISDPGNLGTIIRTADWFGVENLLLSEGSVEAHNEKVVRSTMGSIFKTKIVESKEVISDLEQLFNYDYRLIGLDIEGDKIKNRPLFRKAVYIFGNESHGLSDNIEKKLSTKYTIAGKGGAESLNVGISVGIVLYNLNL